MRTYIDIVLSSGETKLISMEGNIDAEAVKRTAENFYINRTKPQTARYANCEASILVFKDKRNSKGITAEYTQIARAEVISGVIKWTRPAMDPDPDREKTEHKIPATAAAIRAHAAALLGPTYTQRELSALIETAGKGHDQYQARSGTAARLYHSADIARRTDANAAAVVTYLRGELMIFFFTT